MKHQPADPQGTLSRLARSQEEPGPHVLEALRREMGAPLVPHAGRNRAALLALSALWLALAVGLTSFRAWGAHGLGLSTSGLALGASAALLLGASLPGPRQRLALGARRALCAALLLGLALCLAASAREFLPWGAALNAAAHGDACFRHALIGAALGTLGLLGLWRGTDPFTPGWTGALLGAVGGLVGAVSVGWVCASTEGWHLLLAHGSGALLASALFAGVGRRWLRP